MPFIRKPGLRRICIICKKRQRRKNSLFCEVCREKDIFIKIKALRESGFARKYSIIDF